MTGEVLATDAAVVVAEDLTRARDGSRDRRPHVSPLLHDGAVNRDGLKVAMNVTSFGGGVGLRRSLVGVVVGVEPPGVLGRPMRPRAMVAVDVLEGEGGSIVVWVEGARIGEDGGLVRHHGVGNRERGR